ncbi:MAG: hypothetical protein QNI89_12545 [Desulfobacterales bacterium]|nr:hypothetical protein [Desulfobacterales bacterium]MDJ0883992.1 hypothetical protein [Desulfobacterales bacterium]MDJ0888130.1 hypothetical protein [Desulfobacterales bacterium]MDJ0990349.1 hypothetical protein [Desulfobacterales bacterium]
MRTIFYVSILISLMVILLAYHPSIMEGQLRVGNPLLDTDGAPGAEKAQLDFVAILGGIVVFIFYFMKFGRWPGPEGTPPGFRPKPTRHFTTWLRYIGWAVVYGFFMMCIYLLIIFFPKLFVNFLEAYIGLGMSGPDTDLLSRVLSTLKESPDNIVPYAVIIVTVVWSAAFAETERTFRRTLQESAMIPTEANRLIEHYERHFEDFQPDMRLARSLIRESPFKLVSEANFSAGDEGTLELRFAQCEYILDQITRLRAKRYFARILMRYQQDFDEAKVAINKLRGKLQNYKSELLETLDAATNPSPRQDNLTLAEANRIWEESHNPLPFERRYFGRMWDQLEKDVLDCLRAILRIVICCVLAIGKSPYQRNALLKKFGLAPPEDIGPVFNKEYGVRAGLVIVGTMVLCSGIYYGVDFIRNGQPDSCQQMNIPIPGDLAEVAVWTIYAVVMHLMGILGGYSVQKWLTEEHRQFEDTPVNTLKLADGLACFVFGFCLNIFFFAAILFPKAQWYQFQYGWPWAVVAGATGSFTGYYMSRSSKLERISYPIMAVQGVVTASFAAGVMLYIYDIALILKPSECVALTSYAIYVVATTFLIGGALSYILQDWITTNRANGRRR